MPKEAFRNLKEVKQNRILDIAQKEFTLKQYEDVSINEIVKKADISRGSFYLYFEDKADIFQYLLLRSRLLLSSYIKRYMDKNLNVYEMVLSLFDAYTDMTKPANDVEFIRKIFEGLNEKNRDFLFREFFEHCKLDLVERYLMKSSVVYSKLSEYEIEAIKDQLFSVLISATSATYKTGNVVKYRELLQINLDIIEKGIQSLVNR